MGEQSYLVQNTNNSRWVASYVQGMGQVILPGVPESSCSSSWKGKAMIYFIRWAKLFGGEKQLFEIDCPIC